MSAIRNLLDEISWEGNAKPYRGGGSGRENVLTAEVFQALDFLPREPFLGRILADAGVNINAEALAMEVLCGDRIHPETGIRIQPDVLLESDDAVILVEAKAIRRGSFQPQQLARNMLIADHLAQGRQAFLLLVLAKEPPIPIKSAGRLPLDEALRASWELLGAHRPNLPAREAITTEVRWTTWEKIAGTTAASCADAEAPYAQSIQRLTASILDAITFHG